MVNTEIIEKIPTVTPNKESTVRNKFSRSAATEKRKLSKINRITSIALRVLPKVVYQ
jgi:hypothetical protein